MSDFQNEEAQKTHDTDRIVFTYLPDPQDERRRVTIARKRTNRPDGILFNFAINRPPSALRDGDQFEKKLGRTISVGRLEKNPFLARIKAGETPLGAILRNMKLCDNIILQRIASYYLNQGQKDANG